MRKLTLLLTTLVVSLTIFSSPSYAKWTKMGVDVNGSTSYVDFERIRKQDGYVHFWRLQELLEPNKWGYLSVKVYTQGDCKLFRFKSLSYSFHKKSMGGGDGQTVNSPKEWRYSPPKSAIEHILKEVCKQ